MDRDFTQRQFLPQDRDFTQRQFHPGVPPTHQALTHGGWEGFLEAAGTKGSQPGVGGLPVGRRRWSRRGREGWETRRLVRPSV